VNRSPFHRPELSKTASIPFIPFLQVVSLPLSYPLPPLFLHLLPSKEDSVFFPPPPYKPNPARDEQTSTLFFLSQPLPLPRRTNPHPLSFFKHCVLPPFVNTMKTSPFFPYALAVPYA